MVRGVNKVILIGNLGEEPNCRTISTGSLVCHFSMVTSETRRNPTTGTPTEYAEWHRVVLWSNLAKIAQDYLHKGSTVYIEGKLRSHSYTDKQGVKRYVTEVVGDELVMLGTRGQSQEGGFASQTRSAPSSIGAGPDAQGSPQYGGAPATNSYDGGATIPFGAPQAPAPAAPQPPYAGTGGAPAEPAPNYGRSAESGGGYGAQSQTGFGQAPYGASSGMSAQNPYQPQPAPQAPAPAPKLDASAFVEPSTLPDEGEDEIPF